MKETKSQIIGEPDLKLGKEELKKKLLERIKNLSLSFSYEEIGLFPRSFSRVLVRFFQQVFLDVENLVIEEYRFYRYLFLTTLKCLLMLIFIPFLVNLFAKNYLVHPLIEYFWNQPEQEIFLNSYQQKRAFAELKDYEEKLYFESLILPAYVSNAHNNNHSSPSISEEIPNSRTEKEIPFKSNSNPFGSLSRNDKLEPTHIASPTISLTSRVGPSSVSMGSSLSPGSSSVLPVSLSRPSSLSRDFSPYDNNNLPEDNNHTTNHTLNQAIKTDHDTSRFAKMNLEEKLKRDFLNTPNGDSISIQRLKELKELGIDLPIFKEGATGSEHKKEPLKKEAFERRLQEKTIELASHYNNLSIEALTNFFADLLSLLSLCYLFVVLDIQITVTKSFLLEVFFGLDDTRKSLFILLITDLLVGYHSSNLWELFFEFIFNHYGLPESQTSIFLLVATLPVLLDVLFKYIIFRHLNRSSPATVATYHAMIE